MTIIENKNDELQELCQVMAKSQIDDGREHNNNNEGDGDDANNYVSELGNNDNADCRKNLQQHQDATDDQQNNKNDPKTTFVYQKCNNGNIYEGHVILHRQRNNNDNDEHTQGNKKVSRLRHGWGKQHYTDTNNNGGSNCSKYIGQFEHNAMQGHGTFYWSNGDFYQGEFHQNQPHGTGKLYTSRNDNVLNGTFYNGSCCGWATKNYGTTGDVFEGYYQYDYAKEQVCDNNDDQETKQMNENGLAPCPPPLSKAITCCRNGYGIYKWSENSIYKGEFFCNQMHGKGMKQVSSTEKYTGEFYNGMAHGMGKTLYANGDMHEGHYANDVPHGYGVYTWASRILHDTTRCTVYHGEFVEGFIQGYGIRESYHGETSDDDDNDNFIVNRDDVPNVYSGEWRQNRRHGQGTMEFSNGNVYEGEYQNGKQHGYGVFIWNDFFHKHYAGHWKEGKQHDEWGMFTAQSHGSHDVFYGGWVNGKRHGKNYWVNTQIPSGNVNIDVQHWFRGTKKTQRQIITQSKEGAVILSEIARIKEQRFVGT